MVGTFPLCAQVSFLLLSFYYSGVCLLFFFQFCSSHALGIWNPRMYVYIHTCMYVYMSELGATLYFRLLTPTLRPPASDIDFRHRFSGFNLQKRDLVTFTRLLDLSPLSNVVLEIVSNKTLFLAFRRTV